MNTVDYLTIELASNPLNTLCEEWLLAELVYSQDMTFSEARRHIADVKRVGAICAALLASVPTDRQSSCRVPKRPKARAATS